MKTKEEQNLKNLKTFFQTTVYGFLLVEAVTKDAGLTTPGKMIEMRKLHQKGLEMAKKANLKNAKSAMEAQLQISLLFNQMLLLQSQPIPPFEKGGWETVKPKFKDELCNCAGMHTFQEIDENKCCICNKPIKK